MSTRHRCLSIPPQDVQCRLIMALPEHSQLQLTVMPLLRVALVVDFAQTSQETMVPRTIRMAEVSTSVRIHLQASLVVLVLCVNN